MARTQGKKPPLTEETEPIESSVQEPKMDEETLEFIRAIDKYRREKNRPFPNWSEVLAILHSLGYKKN